MSPRPSVLTQHSGSAEIPLDVSFTLRQAFIPGSQVISTPGSWYTNLDGFIDRGDARSDVFPARRAGRRGLVSQLVQPGNLSAAGRRNLQLGAQRRQLDTQLLVLGGFPYCHRRPILSFADCDFGVGSICVLASWAAFAVRCACRVAFRRDRRWLEHAAGQAEPQRAQDDQRGGFPVGRSVFRVASRYPCSRFSPRSLRSLR